MRRHAGSEHRLDGVPSRATEGLAHTGGKSATVGPGHLQAFAEGKDVQVLHTVVCASGGPEQIKLLLEKLGENRILSNLWMNEV